MKELIFLTQFNLYSSLIPMATKHLHNVIQESGYPCFANMNETIYREVMVEMVYKINYVYTLLDFGVVGICYLLSSMNL